MSERATERRGTQWDPQQQTMPERSLSEKRDMDEDPFIQLVNLLSHIAGDLIDELELPGGPPRNHPTYLATLIGLEGEEVGEMTVPAGSNGYPPMRVATAFARPVKIAEEFSLQNCPRFDAVEFEAYGRCLSGCCVWYRRTTPLWKQ